jgi:hypothetical protein
MNQGAAQPSPGPAAEALAAAIIRLAFSLRSADLTAATAAVARAEALATKVPSDKLVRRPDITARVLSGRGAVELWSGHLDEAADVLESGIAATASGGENEPADCLGSLALTEALRGRLRRAATVADRATAALSSSVPTGACSHRPCATISFIRAASRSKPRAGRLSRSASANGRYYDMCHGC